MRQQPLTCSRWPLHAQSYGPQQPIQNHQHEHTTFQNNNQIQEQHDDHRNFLSFLKSQQTMGIHQIQEQQDDHRNFLNFLKS